MQIFRDMWANIYVRIGLLVLVALIVFLLIYRQKMPIYNYFLRSFSGMLYDDLTTWDQRPFEANPELATYLYQDGLEQLAQMGLETYEIPYEEILQKNISINGNYTNHLTQEANMALAYMLDDMHIFCPPLSSFSDARSNWETTEKLKTRRLKYQKGGKNRPFDYGISREKFLEYRKKILSLDQSLFYAALQYNPLSQAVINLRSDIYRSICRPSFSAQDWQRALNYLEDKAEEKVRKKNKEKKIEPTTENLLSQVYASLHKSSDYQNTLENFMRQMNLETGRIQYKADQNLKAYRLYFNFNDLKKYLKNQLQIVRSLSKAEAQRLFVELFALEDPGLSREPDYVYLLAEAAWRAGDNTKALAIVKNILRDGIYMGNGDFRRLQRLKFILETP